MENLLIYVCETQGRAPEWIKVLPLGPVEFRDGREPIGSAQDDLEGMVRAFRADGINLVIDYEHQTLTGDKALAAGWIKDLEARTDGLYARVDWTEAARQEIEARQYGYYSPVLTLDPETRRPKKLLHAALTNAPAMSNIPSLLAAKYGGEAGEVLVLRDFSASERTRGAQQGWAMPDGSFPIKSREDVKNAVQAIGRAKDQEAAKKHIIARAKALGCMDLLPADWPGSKNREEAAMKTVVAGLLALKAETPDEEVLAALRLRLDALPEIAQAAGLKPEASVSEIKGTVLALKQGQGELVELKTKVAALETASAQTKAEAAVQEALDARKITPGEKEFALKYALQDLEAFKAWVAAKPEVMAGDGDRLRTPKGGGTGQEGLDSEQMAMCATAGVKPEAFKASHQQLIEQGLLKDGR